jgi:hypothetical protein
MQVHQRSNSYENRTEAFRAKLEIYIYTTPYTIESSRSPSKPAKMPSEATNEDGHPQPAKPDAPVYWQLTITSGWEDRVGWPGNWYMSTTREWGSKPDDEDRKTKMIRSDFHTLGLTWNGADDRHGGLDYMKTEEWTTIQCK